MQESLEGQFTRHELGIESLQRVERAWMSR